MVDTNFTAISTGNKEAFDLSDLISMIADATNRAKSRLQAIKNQGSAISIADMFDMQMLMNNLSQLSEMSTAVVNACNQAINGMARNVKG